MIPIPRHTTARLLRVPGVACLLFLAGAAGLGAAQRALTPQDVAAIREVREIAVAPDGSRVAYVLSVPRRPYEDEDGPAWAELHVVDRAGNSRPFVTGQVNVSDVAWTPDGRSISFLAKRGDDEHDSIYRIPADGGEARRLVSHAEDITAYSWSPDGARVAYLSREERPERLRTLRDKGFDQEIYEEDVRPVKVWVVAPEAKGEEPAPLPIEGSASLLRWSPVGDRLAMAVAPTALVDDGYTSRQVVVAGVESGIILGRVEHAGKLEEIAWSPDGASLAILAGEDPHDPSAGRLLVAPAAGGAPRDLLPGLEAEVEAVAWSGPGSLVFVVDEGVWSRVEEIRPDGGGRRTRVSAGRPVFSGLDVARDGATLALRAESPGHPAEVFLLRRGDPEPVRLTDSNPWLTEIAMGSQEVVTYRARDGLELHGILIRPVEAQDGVRYPLILVVHGGPESHYSNEWLTTYSLPGQAAAGAGFAVFHPNYRGSTGRGVAFSKSSQADPAGKEFDDLVDAVDHLVATGLVDGGKVGITGGSYGGYASGWGATYYSDRFAAAVMFVGISDKVSKIGTTDIPEEEFLVHARKRVWDDWEFFLERSPIYHAHKNRTPTLILHGKDDPRVNPGQSRELYRHLRSRGGAPVRLVLYPGEKHGNRRAASRLDYSLRLMRWMEHYLKGPGGDPPPHEIDYGFPAEDPDAGE